MAGTNGRADVVGPPITLGDFLPERREVIINGQTYLAWVTTNKRYPRSVMAKLDRAARVYNNAVESLLKEDTSLEDRIKAAEVQPEAWQQYVTDSVMLLVPNLLESEAELIDIVILEDLLKQLGYFKDIAPEQESDGAAEEGPLTGDSSPADSVDTTQATPSTNN